MKMIDVHVYTYTVLYWMLTVLAPNWLLEESPLTNLSWKVLYAKLIMLDDW